MEQPVNLSHRLTIPIPWNKVRSCPMKRRQFLTAGTAVMAARHYAL